MHSFKQSKNLPYSAVELFNLVLDIESYPGFLPWCGAARILSKTEEEIIAELVIQARGFSEKYQSQITYAKLDKEIYSIEVEAISGPFKFLKNSWLIEAQPKGANITFNIDFQMKSILLDKLLGMFFEKATKKMIEAFEKRAGEILL